MRRIVTDPVLVYLHMCKSLIDFRTFKYKIKDKLLPVLKGFHITEIFKQLQNLQRYLSTRNRLTDWLIFIFIWSISIRNSSNISCRLINMYCLYQITANCSFDAILIVSIFIHWTFRCSSASIHHCWYSLYSSSNRCCVVNLIYWISNRSWYKKKLLMNLSNANIIHINSVITNRDNRLLHEYVQFYIFFVNVRDNIVRVFGDHSIRFADIWSITIKLCTNSS